MAIRGIMVSQPSDVCASLAATLRTYVPKQAWSAQQRKACMPNAVCERFAAMLATDAQREGFNAAVEHCLTL